MNDPDHGLIVGSKAGDRVAFGKLISKHYDMVYAVSFGILRNREEALDATQSVFLKVFHEIQNFHGQSKFKTWLYRIAANAAIDECRKRRPAEPLEGEAVFESRGASPMEAASRLEIRGLIEKAMNALSPEHRAVFVMREWNELSYDEIAEILHISLGTVKSRLARARQALKCELESMMQQAPARLPVWNPAE